MIRKVINKPNISIKVIWESTYKFIPTKPSTGLVLKESLLLSTCLLVMFVPFSYKLLQPAPSTDKIMR